MDNQKTKELQAKSERAPWVEPTLSRLTAGSAELLVAVTNDGPGDES